MEHLENIRGDIARRVRELRLARRWSQTELAARLGLSQSRLSELERGDGSFTAEQLLVLARLFNIAPSDFATREARDEYAELQNALARHGATHLQESEGVLPRAELDVARVIRDALVSGVPRLVTALAPVLVVHIDHVNLTRLHAALAEAGFERRLSWLVENVLAAARAELSASPPRAWSKRYRRAIVVLETELDAAVARRRGEPVPDLLDRDIRSAKTRQQVEESASDISRRWGIVTALQPGDFARALGAARGDH